MIQSSSTAQLRPGTQFNESYTVMDNKEVVDALVKAIDDLKSQVISLDPKETLKAATVKRYQIGNKEPNELNESIKRKLVGRIVRKVIN